MNHASSSHVSPSPLDDCLREAVHRCCRGWLREQADDISQASQVRLLGRARAEAPVTPAYVRRVARNAVTDAVRRRSRRDALWQVHQAAAAPRSASRDPERALLDRELAQAIREQLERLAPARREIVALHLEGHGVTEIAERLGCPRKHADNHLYRGLAVLRRALAERGLAPEAFAA